MKLKDNYYNYFYYKLLLADLLGVERNYNKYGKTQIRPKGWAMRKVKKTYSTKTGACSARTWKPRAQLILGEPLVSVFWTKESILT